jgi:preprotein translocase subunit YajC
MLHAEEIAGAEPSKAYVLLMNLLPFVLIFVVFYFLLIRPQKKKQKLLLDMINSLKSGDKVILSSGITGTVSKVKEGNEVAVEIASGVVVNVIKSHITSVVKE